MQFKSFHWLSHHGLCAIIPCSTNIVSVHMIFLEHFYFYFSLVFNILGVFLIKELFISFTLDWCCDVYGFWIECLGFKAIMVLLSWNSIQHALFILNSPFPLPEISQLNKFIQMAIFCRKYLIKCWG